MSHVYVVHHVRCSEDGSEEDVKLIGVYSSEQRARDAVARLTLQPGFSDYPDGFVVEPYELDKDHWAEGFVDLS